MGAVVTNFEHRCWMRAAIASKAGVWLEPSSPADGRTLSQLWKRGYLLRDRPLKPARYRVGPFWMANLT